MRKLLIFAVKLLKNEKVVFNLITALRPLF